MSSDLKTKVYQDDQVSFDDDPKLAAQLEAAAGHVEIPDRAKKEKKLLRKLDLRFSILILIYSAVPLPPRLCPHLYLT